MISLTKLDKTTVKRGSDTTDINDIITRPVGAGIFMSVVSGVKVEVELQHREETRHV